jgi:hypothetical protein
MRLRRPSRLVRDARGVTIVEFAIVLPVLCMLLLGALDLGYRAYAAAVLQGALQEAARMSTVGGKSMDEINQRVHERLSMFTSHGTLAISTASYFDFTRVDKMEPIVADHGGDPNTPDVSGDCWTDVNNDGGWDEQGRSGVGSAEDVVRYRATLTFPHILPVGSFIPGWNDDVVISAETMLRNQPYAGRNTSWPVVCIP